MEKARQNKISHKELKLILKKTLTVALPLIIEGIVYQLQSLTDKAFLGNLDTKYISAMGAAQMPYIASMCSIDALCTGLIIIVSKYYGAGDEKSVRTYTKSALLYTTIFCFGMFALWEFATYPILSFFQIDPTIIQYSVSYVRICAFYFLLIGIEAGFLSMLQGIGETKPIMYSGLFKVGLNIFFSWVLIYGKFGFPAMNVEGAAIGTLAANIVAFIFVVLYCLVWKGKKYRLIDHDWSFVRPKYYGKVLSLGLPVCAEYLLWNSSNLVLVRFINEFSYLDMAIYTLTIGIQMFVCVFFDGASRATLTLIGQSIGAGHKERANEFFFTTIIMNFITVGTATILFLLIPNLILDIFSNDPAVIQNGSSFLAWIGFIMFPQSVNVLCGSAIKANGNTKWMLYSQILGSILVVSVSWFLITILHFDLIAVYLTIFFDELIRGTINFIYYIKKYGTYRTKEN